MFPCLERLLCMNEHQQRPSPTNRSASPHIWLEGFTRAFSVICPVHGASAVWRVWLRR
jgi:hypothetical protein